MYLDMTVPLYDKKVVLSLTCSFTQVCTRKLCCSLLLAGTKTQRKHLPLLLPFTITRAAIRSALFPQFAKFLSRWS